MKVHIINQDNNTTTYGIYEDSLKPIGIVEVNACGTHAFALGYKYTYKDIINIFTAQKGA